MNDAAKAPLAPDQAYASVKAGAQEGAPRISGEFIRQALLGEVAVPSDSPLKLDSRGARLEGVVVEGTLDLTGMSFRHPIAFERSTFLGPVILRDARLARVSFAASSAPSISAELAEIDGDLNLGGARLDNPGGIAFNGHGIRISGSLHLSDGFLADGAVNLALAVIEGALACQQATIRHPYRKDRHKDFPGPVGVGGFALDGQYMRVAQTVMLEFVSIEGIVVFGYAQIGGSLFVRGSSIVCAGGSWSGLHLSNVHVGGTLMLATARAFEGTLFLRGVEAKNFGDDGSFWQDRVTHQLLAGVEVELDHFHYSTFFDGPAVHTDSSWQTRLAWLKAQPEEMWTTDFRAQPFTQCAEVLHAMGDARGARMILFERERLRLKSNKIGTFEKLGGHVMGAFAGYGYKNHYALYWALGVWLIGALVFGVADRLGEMRPADAHVLVEEAYQETHRPPGDYEPVNAALYSADIFLPIVELGQQEYWIPRNAGEHAPNAQEAFPHLAAPIAYALNWAFGGWLPKAYYYFEIAMGWLLVSIVIAGFSGLLGHAREE